MLRETILIVEDDAATRAFLAERIKSDLGLTVTAASTLLDAGKFLTTALLALRSYSMLACPTVMAVISV
jgi:CheY-like chemotaxis protein